MLDWPSHAFFQIAFKGRVLWAFDREFAVALLGFVEASDRDFGKHKFRSSLMKVPKVFLEKGARVEVAKRLRRILKPA